MAAAALVRADSTSSPLAAVTGDSDAALRASLLAALAELDDLEYCPWDRVAAWLQAQGSVPPASDAAARGIAARQCSQSGSGGGGDGGEETDADADGAPATPAARSIRAVARSDAGCSSAAAAQGADFDAPDWWQDAVCARLQQRREAFLGSWWERARVLVSLAAQRAGYPLRL